MIAKFARLEFELFTKPSKSDFLGVYQTWNRQKNLDKTNKVPVALTK